MARHYGAGTGQHLTASLLARATQYIPNAAKQKVRDIHAPEKGTASNRSEKPSDAVSKMGSVTKPTRESIGGPDVAATDTDRRN